ncbi:MAG: hypothetical protein U9N46_11700 [Euryarchaeota archaeon]|nr:hypothetical protein [Euryarchaeota archaeon]
MKQMKAIFAVSLLLACAFMPCVAAAEGVNEDETKYDAVYDEYADEIVETSPLTQNKGAHAMNDIRGMRGKNDMQGMGQGYATADDAESRLMHVLDEMTGRLETLQERLETAEENSILIPENASENIDRYIMRLDGYRDEVEATETPADYRSVARAIRNEWRLIHRELARCTELLLTARLDECLEKTSPICEDLDARIEELKEDGLNTTDLELKMDALFGTLDCARENYELALEAASSDDVDPAEVRQHIHDATRCARDANPIMRDVIREVRMLSCYWDRAVVLNGTGTLEASGAGTAVVKGSLSPSLTADYGTLMVRDRAGDLKITVTGNGVKDQAGKYIIYHGFDGTVDLTGSDVAVTMIGSGVDMTVTGTGRAILVGEGSYGVTAGAGGIGDCEIASGDWQEPDEDYIYVMPKRIGEVQPQNGGIGRYFL